MALRIHDNVVAGEIDNRSKGIVRGKIWLEGQPEPILLELNGNAHPDLAGCLLTFSNRGRRFADPGLERISRHQQGMVGDLTASRKARVLDVSVEEAYAMSKHGEKPPEHVANSLYLEWFSETNGRVVIESTDYHLTISPPQWKLTPEENEQRARDVARAMGTFLQRLTDAIEHHKRGQKEHEQPWDEHDYERFLKESDARTEKYGELLEKYGDSDEADAVIAREMGWERELGEEEAEEQERRIDEMNRACEEALAEPEPEPDRHREGIDWIRTESGDLRHPLQHRAFEAAMKFHRVVEELNDDEVRDDLDAFVFEFQTTSVKLAGALNGIARGQGFHDPALTVAYLKRALDHLHKAQAALSAVVAKGLLPPEISTEARQEVFATREGILQLMDEFRGQIGGI
ncbi:MAG TPA: hypothetical protein VJU77_14525 [Chthoniobacterales bacterium]|nr:hypothetical protein [Chthoniobacterales bacterium]